MPESMESIRRDAYEQMWTALAQDDHRADPQMVLAAMDVVRVALAKQRGLIARQIGAEARRAAGGRYPDGCREITYAAGMRRAARVAKATNDTAVFDAFVWGGGGDA